MARTRAWAEARTCVRPCKSTEAWTCMCMCAPEVADGGGRRERPWPAKEGVGGHVTISVCKVRVEVDVKLAACTAPHRTAPHRTAPQRGPI
jgi:hypothetical protein